MALACLAGETGLKVGSEWVLSLNYKVAPDALMAHVKAELRPQSGESDDALLVRYFKKNGIEIKSPEYISLNKNAQLLFIQATQSHVARIEPLILKFAKVH